MTVADSSFLVERLLENRGSWGEEELVSPDLAVAEVVNAVLLQQRIFHSIQDGAPYIRSFFDAIDAGSLQLVRITESLAAEAYDVALRNNATFYDCLFVALALRYGTDLKTLDRKQAQVHAKELVLSEGAPTTRS